MNSIIDPHLHLFDLAQGSYQWLRPDNAPNWPGKQKICRDFQQGDLILESPLALAGFVHIEAGFDNQQPWREVAWLEQSCSLPFKSVAFADITADNFAENIQQLSVYNSVAGIRHILEQDAVSILLHPNTLSNLTILSQRGWLFEAQLMLDDSIAVDALLGVMQQLPELKVVINHAGFGYRCSDSTSWLASIKRLSQFPQVFIKCSGWEMSHWHWSLSEVKVLLEQILSAFGPHRTMLASNFPVALLSKNYNSLWQDYTALFEDKTLTQALCFDNARDCYQLAL